MSETPCHKGFRTLSGLEPGQNRELKYNDIALVASANNVKKMYFSEKQLLTCKEIVTFTLPKLHRGKSWYVDFFAYDPSIDGLRRKKYMLNRYKTRKEKESMATILIQNIYQRLIAGWNPFTQGKRTRQYTELSVVLQRYQDFISYQAEKGVMKIKTATLLEPVKKTE